MIQEELTIRLPPAIANGDGTFSCRTYPLTVYARQGWRQVQLTGVDIVPNVGIVEVWANDPGGQARRHASQGGSTAIPQVQADELRPLSVTLVNLNSESAVDVVVRFAGFPLFQGYGGAYGTARFIGAYPLGTNGNAETPATIADTDGSTIVRAEGACLNAILTTDGPFTARSILQTTGQVRVLSPTGTGSIPTSGGPVRTVIIKKDGVVLEASADTLNLLSTMFSMTLSPAGQVNITDFAADAIESVHIAAGAVDSVAIDNDAVINQHISAGAIDDAAMIANGILTFAKIAAASIGHGSGKLSEGNHQHAIAEPFFDMTTLGYSFHSVTATQATMASFNLGPLLTGVDYFVVAFSHAQMNAPSGQTIQVFTRIEAGGSVIAGESTGVPSGERSGIAFTAKKVTGTGASINIAMRGQTSSGSGSFSDGTLFAFAFPLKVNQSA